MLNNSSRSVLGARRARKSAMNGLRGAEGEIWEVRVVGGRVVNGWPLDSWKIYETKALRCFGGSRIFPLISPGGENPDNSRVYSFDRRFGPTESASIYYQPLFAIWPIHAC